MPYIPRSNPFRRVGPIRIVSRRYVPAPGMSGLFDDIVKGIGTTIKTAVVTSAGAARTALVGTAKQEAAAAASRLAIKALQKKAKKTATPAPVPGTGPLPAAPAVPAAPEASRALVPAAVPGQGPQVYMVPSEGFLARNWPYVLGGAGVLVVVVLVARRRAK